MVWLAITNDTWWLTLKMKIGFFYLANHALKFSCRLNANQKQTFNFWLLKMENFPKKIELLFAVSLEDAIENTRVQCQHEDKLHFYRSKQSSAQLSNIFLVECISFSLTSWICVFKDKIEPNANNVVQFTAFSVTVNETQCWSKSWKYTYNIKVEIWRWSKKSNSMDYINRPIDKCQVFRCDDIETMDFYFFGFYNEKKPLRQLWWQRFKWWIFSFIFFFILEKYFLVVVGCVQKPVACVIWKADIFFNLMLSTHPNDFRLTKAFV